MRVRLWCVVCLALCAVCGEGGAATRIQVAGLQYQLDKTPAWVERISEPAVVPDSLRQAGAMLALVQDTQVNLLGPKPIVYSHAKYLVQERSGLEGVSTLKIQFNPRYETLTLHDLAVFRDGRRIDRLKSARVDLAQRERRLEEGVYDEDVEAIVALADVRVGDTVEFGYSVGGENPIFAGRHSGFHALNREYPVARLAVRIQYPAQRKLDHRLHLSDAVVAESQDGSVRRLRLDAASLMPVRPEQAVPAWFAITPWLQVSEYSGWDEVGAWARTLYEVPSDLGPDIEAVLEQIRQRAATPEAQAAEALAWVQNEIRYYSIVVGSSSHRPNPPGVTVRQRFGDCKDKSLLLAAMLRRLGVDAVPALVASQLRHKASELLPTPKAFDHVIVHARIGERTYWLDGTRTYQGRLLESIGFTPFGKAFLIGASSPAHWADVIRPPAYRSGVEVVETFTVRTFGEPVQLQLEQRFRGALAEWMRNQVAASGLVRTMESVQSDYARDFPNLAATGEASLTDDAQANLVTVTQTFNVPAPFSYENGRAKMAGLYARSLVPWLRYPGAAERRYPLALPFQENLEHSIVVDLPNKLEVTPPPPDSWQDKHYALSSRILVEGRRVSFRYAARALQDSVLAADFPQFSEKFKQASSMLFSTLSVPLFDVPQLRQRLIRDFEKAEVNFRQPDQLDTYQQNFLRDYAVADEALRGGLVAGTLLAKVYLDRAQAASLLGRRPEALADVRKSLELDDSEKTRIAMAEIQLYSSRYQDALATLVPVLGASAKADAYVAAGMSSFYLGRYDDASSQFARAADLAGPSELPYALIWLVMSERRLGRSPVVAVQRHRARLDSGWPSEAVSFVLGEGGAEALLGAARRDEKERRLRLCEAYFYLGQIALLDGRTQEARRWFDKSVDTQAVMYREYTFSQHELKRLAH